MDKPKLILDLNKGGRLNTTRLVKRAVQVKGKDGKIFTRQQWVNPHDGSVGHGIRHIRSEHHFHEAIADGADEHKHFYHAMKDQGVDPNNHDWDKHPAFFVPETEESARKATRNDLPNFYPHGAHVPEEVHKIHKKDHVALAKEDNDDFEIPPLDYGDEFEDISDEELDRMVLDDFDDPFNEDDYEAPLDPKYLDPNYGHGQTITANTSRKPHVRGNISQPHKPLKETLLKIWKDDKEYEHVGRGLAIDYKNNNRGDSYTTSDYEEALRDHYEDCFNWVFHDMSLNDLEDVFSSPDGDWWAETDYINPTFNLPWDTPPPEELAEHVTPGFKLNLRLHGPKGAIGHLERYVEVRPDNSVRITNALLSIGRKHQDNNIANTIYSQSEDLWRKIGNDKIKPSKIEICLQANISIGRYAWAKKGFEFTYPIEGAQQARNQLKDFLIAHDIGIDEVCRENNIDSLDELTSPAHFANLVCKSTFDLEILGDSKRDWDGRNPYKGIAHLGKAFMLLGKTDWDGTKILDRGDVEKSIKQDPLQHFAGMPVIKAKRTVKDKHVSKEGLMTDENGKTIYDDSWMHPEVFEQPVLSKSDAMLLIDLEKAVRTTKPGGNGGRLDTAKLIKRQVQVKGKNGKIFTRMQWVSPGAADTGHGVRSIHSKEAWQNAKRDGIHEHPQYHVALADQGVHEHSHEDHHPHFFLPETKESKENFLKRQEQGQTKPEHEHHDLSKHKVHANNAFTTEKPNVPHSEVIQNLIDACVTGYDKSLDGKSSYNYSEHLEQISKRLDSHWESLRNTMVADVHANVKDVRVRNTILGAIDHGHTNHGLRVAMHPDLAKSTIDHVLGKEFASELREAFKHTCLSVNLPVSNLKSVKENGYASSTLKGYAYKQMVEGDDSDDGKECYDQLMKVLSGDHPLIDQIAEDDDLDLTDNRELHKTMMEAIEVLIDDYDGSTLLEVQERAEAEFKAFGLEIFEDVKPVYIAANVDHNPDGGASGFGDRWVKVDPEILNHSTLTLDDSFNDTRCIPRVHSLDHLRDIFILKLMEGNSELDDFEGMLPKMPKDRISEELVGSISEIPLEIQYHHPKLETSQFEVMPDPYKDPAYYQSFGYNVEKPKFEVTENEGFSKYLGFDESKYEVEQELE